MTKKDSAMRGALPADFFSNPEKSKMALAQMTKKVTEVMVEDDSLQRAIWKWQSRFLFRRQAPQEVLKTNIEAL